MSQIIDGKKLAEALMADMAHDVKSLKSDYGAVPGLAVVLVGNDPASQVYVASKKAKAKALGFHAVTHTLEDNVSKAALLTLIADLNKDPEIHGILVQMPLPKGLEARDIIAAIDPLKDVDGLHSLNVGHLWTGEDGAIPCTPLGCLKLLQQYAGGLSGKHAVMVGRSDLMGKPMAALLLGQDCTVTLAHSKSRNLPDICRLADILIVAVGKPRLIKGDWIKKGAVVLDVGINRLPSEDGGRSRLVGDVAYDEALSIASAITPVPGGVGPMTIACLMENTLKAFRKSLPMSRSGLKPFVEPC